MSFTNTPNMQMPLPTVSNEPGPQFATDVNQCIGILDGHNHSPGSGVPIGAQSINIQTDLSFNIQNATNLRTVRFVSSTASSGTDIGCLYVRGNDLFYNDLSANVVRITQNGGLSTTAQFIGSISTTAIVSAAGPTPATSGFIRMNNNSDFVSWRNAGNSGDNKIYFDNSDNLQVIGGPNTGVQAFNVQLKDYQSGKIITVSPSESVSTSAYNLLLPVSPSTGIGPLYLDTIGAVSVKSTLTSGHFSANINFPGKAVQSNGNDLVVANTNPSTNGLSIIRGQVTGSVPTAGEGFTAINPFSGIYTVIFSTPFLDAPSVVATVGTSGGGISAAYVAIINTVTPSSAQIQTYVSNTGASSNVPFTFIAIGQRA